MHRRPNRSNVNRMAQWKEFFKIIILGFLIHILLFMAVIDIYFSSPIDHGMTPIKSTERPPAKRAVLFVADGLYADALYVENNGTNGPYLNTIRAKRGSWGVSQTRVPTESRPGHVAMLGGIYEDPSAILKGWTTNPVDFDSVINQSTNAWCWGSPDIVSIFNKDKLRHIHVHTYDRNMEDFGQHNTSILDLWVFDEVEKFITDQIECVHCKRFRANGNLFFLHLLGIDTAGHGYKPHSTEYVDNIKIVDQNIKRIERLFESAFNDSSTAYIFTSDHGMTDWGSHGSGSNRETNTPIIAWGAGIKIENARKDINQVDIAPLLASLIGINIPINSLGQLPYYYLNVTNAIICEMMMSNMRQLMEIFNIKRLRTEANAILFKPYSHLTSSIVAEKEFFFQRLIDEGQYYRTIILCTDHMNVIIKGLDYYHNYYQIPILFSIALGLIGWLFYLSFNAIYGHSTYRYILSPRRNQSAINHSFVFLYCFVVLVAMVQNVPITYYFYFTFPVVTLQLTCGRYMLVYHNLKAFINYANTNHGMSVVSLFSSGLVFFIYGFYDKTVYSLLLYVFILWYHLTKHVHRGLGQCESRTWSKICIIVSIFPLLPVMQTAFNLPAYVIGCALGWLKGHVMLRALCNNPRVLNSSLAVVKLQRLLFQVSAIIVIAAEFGVLQNDSPMKYFSWIVAVLPVAIIPLSQNTLSVRLTAVILGFWPFYMLVSTNYEPLFLMFYSNLLAYWLFMELDLVSIENYDNVMMEMQFGRGAAVERVHNVDNFRSGFIFMGLILLGFFGTGNIASLNSFDPMWVRCFLTVFSPFTMAGLILMKMIIPFVYSCCYLRAINNYCRRSILMTLRVILIISDLMMLFFLFQITNVGSWLDIGTNFSHFIIMDAFILIIIFLYGVGYLLTSWTIDMS